MCQSFRDGAGPGKRGSAAVVQIHSRVGAERGAEARNAHSERSPALQPGDPTHTRDGPVFGPDYPDTAGRVGSSRVGKLVIPCLAVGTPPRAPTKNIFSGRVFSMLAYHQSPGIFQRDPAPGVFHLNPGVIRRPLRGRH